MRQCHQPRAHLFILCRGKAPILNELIHLTFPSCRKVGRLAGANYLRTQIAASLLTNNASLIDFTWNSTQDALCDIAAAAADELPRIVAVNKNGGKLQQGSFDDKRKQERSHHQNSLSYCCSSTPNNGIRGRSYATQYATILSRICEQLTYTNRLGRRNTKSIHYNYEGRRGPAVAVMPGRKRCRSWNSVKT